MRVLRGFIYVCAVSVGVNALAQPAGTPTTVTPTSVNPTSVTPTNAPTTPVTPTNAPTTPNVPAPPTGPGPSTGGPFGIRLEVHGTRPRPSDFAHAEYQPGDEVTLGANFYDTANGQTLHGSCIPEYDLENIRGPDGSPRAKFDGIGAEVTDGGTKCHGSCQVKFLKDGAFSVHVHCLDHPEISSAGNDGDFNFETSRAPWSGVRTLHPTTPTLLHPAGQPIAVNTPPTPPPADAGKAPPAHKGVSIGTQLLLGAVLVGGVIAVVELASPGGGGGGGGGTTVYCFDVSASCSAAGRYCDFTSDACMVDESDVLKLCSDSCGCQISRSCFSCTMNVDGCMPSGGRVGPPQDVDFPVTNGVATRLAPRTSAETPAPLRTTSSADAGFPWLRVAELTVVVAATTFTVWELVHSKKPMRLAPWMGPEGGGLTVTGAF